MAACRCPVCSSALNTQILIALGPERLADLLLELADLKPAIKRRIRLATIALRSMVDFTLRNARSSRYGHAAHPLQSCERLG